jgi:glycosyltransferase involved in cell wall biosynthesis
MSDFDRTLFVLPNFARNGAVDFIVDLADAMALQEIDVEILALNGTNRPSRSPKGPVTVSVALAEEPSWLRRAVPVRQIRQVLRAPVQIGRILHSALRSDVIVLTWEMGAALLLPSLAAYLLRKPTIAIVQNNVLRSVIDYHGIKWQHVLRWSYARARAVVCVSVDQMVVVEQAGVSSSKLVTIPNAVDIERVRRLAGYPPPTILKVDEMPFVVGVGRLSEQKGFDLLIQAHADVLRRGFRHRLVLIGEGPDMQAMAELAAEKGVAESVIFPGYLVNPYPALVRASVFCLSSRYEGRPLVLAEAAILGVPTIATDCPTGAREVLGDGLYGDLVKTESVEALSTAIERYLRDPQRLLLKAQASASESARFSIQNCAQSYIKLIRQVLD